MGEGTSCTGYSRNAVSEDLTFIHTQGDNLEITGQTAGGLVQGDASAGKSRLLLTMLDLQAAVSGMWFKKGTNCKTPKHKKTTYYT